MSGPVSPALERYRAARAAPAEHELALKQGQAVTLADLETVLWPLLGLFRAASERIQRLNLTGVEAVQAINEIADDTDKIMLERFGISQTRSQDGKCPLCLQQLPIQPDAPSGSPREGLTTLAIRP
jgi:hypothetical protein